MSVMKFTIEIDLESILSDTQNEHANMPIPKLEEAINDALIVALAEIQNSYGVSIELKDEQGKEIYI